MKFLSKAECELIDALYSEGKTGKEMSALLCRPHNTIYGYLNRRGLRRKYRRGNIDEAKFRKMWRDGVPYHELKAEFGIRSNSVIARLRHKLGLPDHPRHNAPPRKYDPNEMVRLLNSGMSVDDVCAKTGIGESYLYQLLKKDRKDTQIVNEPRPDIPADRIELRERLYAAPYRDLTGYLAGDPKVGFSALDRR